MNALRSFQGYVFGTKGSKSSKPKSSKAPAPAPSKPGPGAPTGAAPPPAGGGGAVAEEVAAAQQPPSTDAPAEASAAEAIPGFPAEGQPAAPGASDQAATQKMAEVEPTLATTTFPAEGAGAEATPQVVAPQIGPSTLASSAPAATEPSLMATSESAALLNPPIAQDGEEVFHFTDDVQPQPASGFYGEEVLDFTDDPQPPHARGVDHVPAPEGDFVIQTDPDSALSSPSRHLSAEDAQIGTPLRWRGELSNNQLMMQEIERREKDLGLADLEEECRRIQIRIAEAREEKANLRARLLEVHEKTDQCAKELSDVNESIQVFQDMRGEELSAERVRAAGIKAQLQATSTEVEHLRVLVEAAKEEHAQQGFNEQLVAELRNLQAQVAECRKSELEASSQASAYGQEVTRLRAALQEMQTADEKNHAEIMRLRATVEDARENALSWQDKYWSDAPFLAATPEDVERAKQQLHERMEAVRKLEAAVQMQQAKLQDMKEAPSSAELEEDSHIPAGSRTLLDTTLPSVSSAPTAESSVLSMTRRPLQSQRIALAAVEEDNKRLRQRIADLKDVLHTVPNTSSWRAAGDAANGEKQQLQTAEGASARVVGQLKQALHDDLGLLRSLSAKRRSLDRS